MGWGDWRVPELTEEVEFRLKVQELMVRRTFRRNPEAVLHQALLLARGRRQFLNEPWRRPAGESWSWRWQPLWVQQEGAARRDRPSAPGGVVCPGGAGGLDRLPAANGGLP
jgi:hypothetical protein